MKSNLVTSKEILEQAGISRATLNNYIKCGILPRPIVSSPGPDQEGVKQIGYFPTNSLLWIKQVKVLKQQGKSMEEIATLFQDKDWVKRLSLKNEITADRRNEPSMQDSAVRRRRHDERRGLKVTIENITSPAYLVNNNLEIEWINEQAEKSIFNRKINSINEIESRNIFKLILDPALHGVMRNWRDMVDLHCTLLQRNMNSDDLAQTYAGITDKDTALLSNAYLNRQAPAIDNLYRLPFSFMRTGSRGLKHFIVHSEAYREGTFVVFIPGDSNSASVIDMLSQREKIINELLHNRMPSVVSLCSMVASIQDSERLCAKLLPSKYFLLINDLWQAVSPVFDKYFGTYGRHAGNEMVYYFTKNKGNDYLINSINCAMEIRDMASRLSHSWNRKHGLDHTLNMNIGIHEGREFFGTIRSAGNIEFTALGESVKVARRLSEFANNGEIWATKDLISKISTEDRHGFTFGVYRDQTKGQVLQPDSFSLAGDYLNSDIASSQVLAPISGFAITEIRDRIHQQQVNISIKN
ncbi:MAG: hypothetical protein K9K37_00530 [Desulfocapsa sp.]|nr:hypothetical protein [Desulfocapsa sp.]